MLKITIRSCASSTVLLFVTEAYTRSEAVSGVIIRDVVPEADDGNLVADTGVPVLLELSVPALCCSR
jgi:hypothetical protein